MVTVDFQGNILFLQRYILRPSANCSVRVLLIANEEVSDNP